MRTPNKNLIASLTDFAENVEESTEELSNAEVAEKLQGHGIDLMKLDARTVKKLRKLRSRLEPSGGLKGLLANQRTMGEPMVASKNEERTGTADSMDPNSKEQQSGSTKSDSD